MVLFIFDSFDFLVKSAVANEWIDVGASTIDAAGLGPIVALLVAFWVDRFWEEGAPTRAFPTLWTTNLCATGASSGYVFENVSFLGGSMRSALDSFVVITGIADAGNSCRFPKVACLLSVIGKRTIATAFFGGGDG